MITKMESGYLGGVRVQLGAIDDFVCTSCVSSMNWIDDMKDGNILYLFFIMKYGIIFILCSEG